MMVIVVVEHYGSRRSCRVRRIATACSTPRVNLRLRAMQAHLACGKTLPAAPVRDTGRTVGTLGIPGRSGIRTRIVRSACRTIDPARVVTVRAGFPGPLPQQLGNSDRTYSATPRGRGFLLVIGVPRTAGG
ncbi:hypothetical protein GCM10010234_05920 [Streptomyces hawaiiensis]